MGIPSQITEDAFFELKHELISKGYATEAYYERGDSAGTNTALFRAATRTLSNAFFSPDAIPMEWHRQTLNQLRDGPDTRFVEGDKREFFKGMQLASYIGQKTLTEAGVLNS